jgi:hypothetical protein
VSDAAGEAERQIDGVFCTDKERATPQKQGDCKRPWYNKKGTLHVKQNIHGDICDYILKHQSFKEKKRTKVKKGTKDIYNGSVF